MHKQLEELSVEPRLAEAYRRARELVAYHMELVSVCLNLAFPKYRSPGLEARRLGLDGLGPPAVHLRQLRDEFHRR